MAKLTDKGDGEITGSASPRTTIVGGRPEVNAPSFPVPTGIQQLLRLAGLNHEFCKRLIEKRGEVAHAAGVGLTPSERAILAAIPAAHLSQMVSTLPPPQPARRDFLRQTAASAVVLLGGAVLSESASGCSPSPSEQPPVTPATDRPFANPPPDEPDRPVHNDTQTTGGIAPEEPPTASPPPPEPVPPRPGTPPPSYGIQPDRPPQKPRPNAGVQSDVPVDQRTRGIRPDMPPDGK